MLVTSAPATQSGNSAPRNLRGGNPAVVWAILAIAFLLPFMLYLATARSMVAIWNSSETFAHGYIILPISLWLVWRHRAIFATAPIRPWWPGLGLLALVGFGWLLARMGEVQVAMQYAFVAMIPAIAITVLGKSLARSLTFPLFFLMLAVPFGEIFVGPLISYTADFTVWALQQSGIPVLRNGTRFEIPSGSWSVVEACSGIRYLISSVTLGCLYAYLTYRSARRRTLFMIAAVIVPIVANWLRAYMIVMIGHLSGMELAVGVDHLIYGWLFFGLVMFLLFWIGSFWREDAADVSAPASLATTPGQSSSAARAARLATPLAPASLLARGAVIRITLAVAVICAIWPLYAAYSDRVTFNAAPVRLSTVGLGLPAAPAFTEWVPRFAAADARFAGVFQTTSGSATQPVSLDVLYYRNQRNGKALISSTNLLTGEKDAAHSLRTARRAESIGGRTLSIRETTLQTTTGNVLVWQWYWVGGTFTANDYEGKLLQARNKLLLRGDDGAAILIATPAAANPDDARIVLRAFVAASLPAVEKALTAARGT